MFTDCSDLLRDNPPQLNYGVAVVDVDRDGAFELVVAGFEARNQVFKWTGSFLVDIADDTIADPLRRAIGVAGGDINGDGHEEIYILNTDTFMGRKRFGDRLFTQRGGRWVDLCSLPENQSALNLTAGRSVIAVDRMGTGHYGFFVANYGGPLRLYELTSLGHLEDVAPRVRIDQVTGGRGVVALPLVSQRMDIFAANEQGANFLFRNRGDGSYEEVAAQFGLADTQQHGRGIAVLDVNNDGQFDLVYGNWEGPHRMFVRDNDGVFYDCASDELALPSRIRTVIAADFDNDGYEELFFNNIGEPNRLFGYRGGQWMLIPIDDALEPDGLGTGAAVGDFDADGRLELMLSHGESGAQPLSFYRTPINANYWLRVRPYTRQGAPARGAVVMLQANGRRQRRVIDAGSGYLCQMEPVAHFGLGEIDRIERVTVRWLDGTVAVINQPTVNRMLDVPYPSA